MPKRNQRREIDSCAPTEVREYLSQLRALVDATGLTDDATARAMGIEPPQLSKLLSGMQMSYRLARALHEATCRITGMEPISVDDLLEMHDMAALSTPSTHKKEFSRALERQKVKKEKGAQRLPVPGPRGDRQAQALGPNSTRAEVFLTDLLKQKGCPTPETLDVLHAGADVLGPPEVADVMANLQHRGESTLADDFAQICGREQNKLSVIHAARDLLDPHGLPAMAARLLTAAMSQRHAGNGS
ncbi:hypothetical protein ACH4RA_11345 [Streptomyces smyrnaeus]|uniref:hypothetical protein n=1 Tax=Streptomyces TaxID=1883 RepID=UPI001B391349|nr:hypothetical protein [Streptomyces sp. RK75]MBQ0867870.1 hypothetical protein [Streptomyces sp. RK75]